MELVLYQVDAFTSELFRGNPAAVVPLSQWLPDEKMQAIAMENQLSETTFFVPSETGYELRWFTPAVEVDLCGHATLATAHILFEELTSFSGKQISFSTRSGILTVEREERGYAMDFPTDEVNPANERKREVSEAIGVPVSEVLQGRHDLVAIVESEETVAALKPDIRKIGELPARGLLVSARGNSVDFVSRCFFPQSGIDEDPVTGSAHTTLAPYWAEQLGRSNLKARQLSARGGNVICRCHGDRITLIGDAVTYLRGVIFA